MTWTELHSAAKNGDIDALREIHNSNTQMNPNEAADGGVCACV